MIGIIEIAMMVFGIIALVKGKVNASKTKEITGAPAYLIGLILTAVFPLALAIGFFVGLNQGMQNQGVQNPNAAADILAFVWIDISLVVGAALGAGVVFALAPKQDKSTPRQKWESGIPQQQGIGSQQPGKPPVRDDNDNPFKDFS